MYIYIKIHICPYTRHISHINITYICILHTNKNIKVRTYINIPQGHDNSLHLLTHAYRLMYIYAYIYKYIYSYVFIYTYIHTYIHTLHKNLHTYTHIFIYKHTSRS
jgi:hypothetical protein